ncbi:MAG: T9SS type A sorting domain-containing protein, partial [Bacteroidota bacterium]
FELAPLSRPTEDQKATTAAASNMLQAAPNPFTASTALTYTLAAPTIVRLELYDNTGRLVRILQDGMLQAADTYQMDMAGEALAPGVYYCRMTAGEQVQVLKLVRAGL